MPENESVSELEDIEEYFPLTPAVERRKPKANSITVHEAIHGDLVVDGVLTIRQIATVLGCEHDVVCNWIRRGFFTELRCGSVRRLRADVQRQDNTPLSSDQEFHAPNTYLLSALQVYYLFKKAALPITETLEANAANFLFFYGFEPDNTNVPHYRVKFFNGDPVDTPESLERLHLLNRLERRAASLHEWQILNNDHHGTKEPPRLSVYVPATLTPVNETDMSDLRYQPIVNVTTGYFANLGPAYGSPEYPGYMSTKQVVDLLFCTPAWISSLIRRGVIAPPYKLKTGSKAYFYSALQILYYCHHYRFLYNQDLRDLAAIFVAEVEKVRVAKPECSQQLDSLLLDQTGGITKSGRSRPRLSTAILK